LSHSSLKILLLQARNPEDQARADERKSFADRAGLALEQIVPHDLLVGPPSLAEIRGHDALMVGGSGDYYVSKGNLPGFSELLHVLRDVVEVKHPMFASCFGFQLLVRAAGGEVVLGTDRTEVGTFELTLTDAGAEDELLGSLPRRFNAQLGHKDHVHRLPNGWLHLASSESSLYQAFRIPDEPIWATQFHPELTGEENRARFLRYLEDYGRYMDRAERDDTMPRFRESPEAEQLIPRFLRLVFA
jgi:GMP synthase (glutamine-hydrolysing)